MGSPAPRGGMETRRRGAAFGQRVERVIGHVAIGKACRIDRLALSIPFACEGFCQRKRIDDLLPPALRFQRPPVEEHLMAGSCAFDMDARIEPLHWPLLQRLASTIGRMNISATPNATRI